MYLWNNSDLRIIIQLLIHMWVDPIQQVCLKAVMWTQDAPEFEILKIQCFNY